MLPNHLFIDSCCGDLHDTRVPDWHKPLRKAFMRHHSIVKTAAEFKATLRAGAYAWPGGYPLYFIMADCEPMHFKCARENAKEIISAMLDSRRPYHGRQWECVACDINYEDSDMYCAQCNGKIESAYGED